MDWLIQLGLDWVIAIQSLGDWLETPMRFFTFLGSEEFFLLILPALYWSIDSALGLRVGMILFFGIWSNELLKMIFAGPRPYWVSERVRPFAAEGSFGVPSGHAQNAAGMWGLMASRLRKKWGWAAATLVIFLIGFSRMYLGVHFPHDVLIGWFLGAVILWAFLRYWDSIAAWLKQKTFGQQILIAFTVSLLMVSTGVLVVAMRAGYTLPPEWIENARRTGEEPDPVSMSGILTVAGSFFGLGFGLAWMASRGGFQASGPLVKRVLRFVLGLTGVVILYIGLGQVFPRGEAFLPYLLRYVRYALVGLWITGGAPWLFFRFNLTEKPKIQDARLL